MVGLAIQHTFAFRKETKHVDHCRVRTQIQKCGEGQIQKRGVRGRQRVMLDKYVEHLRDGRRLGCFRSVVYL